MVRPIFFVSIVAALICVLFTGRLATAQDADGIAKRLQEKYDTVQSLQADFTQTMKSEFLDASESSTGRFIMNGKKIRVEAGAQTFVTDGVVTWLYNAESGEVIVNDYVEEDMFPVRELIFDYEAKFNVDGVRPDTFQGAKVKVLALIAKADTDLYRTVKLFVRDSDSIVVRLEILDANDTLMTFDLTHVEINPTLDTDLFTFIAPDGVEIIDLRS